MTRYATLLALLLSGCTTTQQTGAAHKTHADFLVLDTHLDTPLHFARPGWSFAGHHDPAADLVQVDMERMAAGALDGGFFAIYTEQGPLTTKGYADALAFARARSDLIDRTLAQFPDRIGSALTPADAHRLNDAGKLIAFKSIENSYPVGDNLSLLGEFYDRGVRLAGPVHGANNQFADSSGDTPRWNGLSPLGRDWVKEMNRLGIAIDASHASDDAFDQMLELSRTPLLLSHSSGRWAFDHPRNLDDARIRRLAAKGGAICVSTIFLSAMNLGPERAELFAQYEHLDQMSPAQQAEHARRWQALDDTDVERRFRAVHDDGAARDRGCRRRPRLLRCRLGRWRRPAGDRGYLGIAAGHRAASPSGLFRRRAGQNVGWQYLAHPWPSAAARRAGAADKQGSRSRQDLLSAQRL
jgi:membrane dipeptidase